MRTESIPYGSERLFRKVAPRYFARFLHTVLNPDMSLSEYPFTVDFASGAVENETKQKLLMLEAIDGAFFQVYPEQGRASVGNIQLTLTNVENLALYYMNAGTFHLAQPMTDSSPGVGEEIHFLETVLNIPAGGTLEITTGGVTERIRYEGLAVPAQTVTVVARGVDDTVAAAHAIGDAVESGEQIRPRQRCQLYAGYDDLDEADYMPFVKMEVVDRRQHEDGEAFVIELADVMRTLRRECFLTASEDSPVVITGDPLDLLLHLLLSTGTGVNGVYDDWPAAWGLGIPLAYVDVDQIQFTSALVDPPDFSFTITGPVNAKEWIEREILQPLNVYPVVTQEGKYSCRRFGGQR